MTEDEMAGWRHRLDGRESEWTQEMVMDREAWRAAWRFMSQRVGHDWATELNWTEPTVAFLSKLESIVSNPAVVVLFT